MVQEQKQPKKSSQDDTEVEDQPEVAERKEQLDEDIDAILDEIDEVLESNAEDFVKSFIQKGGESQPHDAARCAHTAAGTPSERPTTAGGVPDSRVLLLPGLPL